MEKIEENWQGSWVELHYTNGSSHGVLEQVPTPVQDMDLENMLLDAQNESGRNSSKGSSQCNSPQRSRTPLHLCPGSEGHSSLSDEDREERKLDVETLMKKKADWIWDWSSRPENIPPKDFVLRHPKRTSTLSIRNSRVMKKGGLFSGGFLMVFLPTLLISHMLAVGLGLYIGRRLSTLKM